jgi:DNA (cytosine-5)-methyltransferase 1
VAVFSEFYLSLFSGCGGFDLSVRIAIPGARCVGYVEREISAARILAARMEDGSMERAPIWSDVRSFPCGVYRDRVAGIIGGFPCTDLSVAGKRAGIVEGEHSSLWFDYLRIIREVRPRWVFVENVPAVIAFPAGGIVLRGLAEAGFDAEWEPKRASDVGAPHRRERVFIYAWDRERGPGGGGGGNLGRPRRAKTRNTQP